MMKIGQTVSTILLVGVVLLTLNGCPRQEGPAERAGKAVDNAVEQTGKQIERAGEKVQDTAKGEKK